jgi:DNA repair protein SbcC/Rad50
MIFNRFFRSKHLDPNPQVRIKAIEKLNTTLSSEKTVLHELAFNDPDASVSLAALHKLDSFTLWYKMSEIGKDERVLKKSQQIVEQMLFDETNVGLNEKDKLSFIRQCNDSKLIEKLVFLPWVQQDTKLTQILLTKLSKTQIVEKVLLETPNLDLQSSLLDKLKDDASNRKLLNKLIKRSHSEQIINQANALLIDWEKLLQLPISVEKETKMLLSRLLALKESADLSYINQQLQMLTDQYSEVSKQFDCLSENKRQEFESKWYELNQRLQKTIDTLTPLWQEQEANKQIRRLITEIQIESAEILDATNVLLSENMVTLTNEEVIGQGNRLNTLYDKVKQLGSTLSPDNLSDRKLLESIIERILQCQESLANLPAFMLCLTQSRELLAQFTALSLPNDISQIEAAEQYLREVKNEWRLCTQRFSKNLPKDLIEQWQKATSNWQTVLRKLTEQVNQNVARCRNKYRAIEGLVEQGRYRLAIDLYSKVVIWYQSLPDKQQLQLQKLQSQVQQQIENLKDWQEYIATPRKPALLAEAENLVSFPLEIEQQSKAVKVLRQQWNSLGVIDSESDQALNQVFEETIERAFAPCRAYYEQQQHIREQNLQQKMAILAELAKLNQTVEPSMNIAKQLSALQQQWRNVGEVEFTLRQSLYEQFQNAIKPLKVRVTAFYKENAEQKEHLITKAKKCYELSSIDDAVNQIKSLQLQWKSIEHAGKKAEAELWPAFRQVCDGVFAKRNEEIEQQKQTQNQLLENIQQQFSAMKLAIEKATSKAAFEAVNEYKINIIEQLALLPTKERSQFERQLVELEKKLAKGLIKLETVQIQRHYDLIFKVLSQWQNADVLPEELVSLPNSWQQAFNIKSVVSSFNRLELTVMLEIIMQQESPKADAKIRQSIQMQLMAEKLQDGANADSDEVLKLWIAKGPVDVKEQPLLVRVQSLFAS